MEGFVDWIYHTPILLHIFRSFFSRKKCQNGCLDALGFRFFCSAYLPTSHCGGFFGLLFLHDSLRLRNPRKTMQVAGLHQLWTEDVLLDVVDIS